MVMTIRETRVCPRLHCDDKTLADVPNSSLSVNLSKAKNTSLRLSDLIRKAFRTDRPGYTCPSDKCNRSTGRCVTRRILTAPHILVIHLNRFIPDENYNPMKREDPIDFAECEDFTAYQEGTWRRLRYRLRSVIQHRGTMNVGHYVTVVRGPSGRRMKMNDNHAVQYTDLQDACSLEPQEKRQLKKGEKAKGNRWTSHLIFWEKVEDVLPATVHSVPANKDYWKSQREQLEGAELEIKAVRKRKRQNAELDSEGDDSERDDD